MGLIDSIKRALAKTYWRESPIVAHMRPHLGGVTNALDIGAGGCRIAELIQLSEGIDVTAVDVVDHNLTSLPLMLYDGKRLPFNDDEFDVSFLVFVLHHAQEQVDLLREAIRVTRSTVLIVEDMPGNAIERGFWRAWDNLLNHCRHDDIDIAHRALSLHEWQQVILEAGASTRTVIEFRTAFPVLRTYPHVLLSVPISKVADIET